MTSSAPVLAPGREGGMRDRATEQGRGGGVEEREKGKRKGGGRESRAYPNMP